MSSTEAFLRARDFLLTNREDYERAYREFRWPELLQFNWALDYFDIWAAGNDASALRIIEDSGLEVALSYSALRERSNRVANYFRSLGVGRGDRILTMLPNAVELWETTLAAMKLGAVLSPATTLLTTHDLEDRIVRGGLSFVVTDSSGVERFGGVSAPFKKIATGEAVPGWHSYSEAYSFPENFSAQGVTASQDPLLLYFTSGTTAKPKMVLHSHLSYPVGHLSTMYWLGIKTGDVHYNISSPGWAKHAWSSFFAPWNAGAEIFIFNTPRFSAKATLGALGRYNVSSLCAPPTVWRMFILEDLTQFPVSLREACSAGEPLNPEVIERVKSAWGVEIRDGYGQTETSAQIANSPGQPLKIGAMGRPLPGYTISLLDTEGCEQNEGEISLALNPSPAGLMSGYVDENETRVAGGFYRTSDVAWRDDDGYFWYVGRADDVFKSADYRISPFELESVLLEHELVAEAAVIPSPDPVRTSVPKAFVVLIPGARRTDEVAMGILAFVRQRVSPYKRIRRIEFAELPKTISGKIRRVQLRAQENELRRGAGRAPNEFWEEDFPALREQTPGARSGL
ncbi:MAG: AMP-binding protein [Bdellovibrionota bacterium]